jgi:hypothetical protein
LLKAVVRKGEGPADPAFLVVVVAADVDVDSDGEDKDVVDVDVEVDVLASSVEVC